MDKDLKEALDCINENLKALVTNQAYLYCRLREIEEEIGQSDPVDKED